MAARELRCEECGRPFTAQRSDRLTCTPACRKRKSRRDAAAATLDDRYEREVWDARRLGLIDPDEALLLLAVPSSTILTRLGAVAA